MSAIREGTYLVPRIGTLISKADLVMILLSFVQKMGYGCPADDQKKTAEAFVLGKDVFISLPTGSGKSLCYACLPHVFNELRRRSGARECMVHHSIVVVVSPLSHLCKTR